MSLYEKMFNVMNESEAVEKSMVVGSGANSYKAVSEAAMLNMIKPLFKKHRLIIFPVGGEIKDHCMTWVKTDFKGNTAQSLRAMTELKVTYRIMDVDTAEFQDVVGFGNGADPQDKGAGKAFTYSLKNALSKTFMLFSGEDTDNQHSDDIGATETPKQTKPPVKTIGQEKAEILAKLFVEKVEAKAIKQTAMKETLKKYGINKLADLTPEQHGKILNGLYKATNEG